VAAGGLAVNIAALLILREGRHDGLNMRGAFLHVLSDALGSLGAMISGALIVLYQMNWADPAASMVIAVLVLHSAWQLLKETVAVLMEGAPAHVNVEKVRDALAANDGVAAVHDLHVWTLTSDKVCMSAHVVTKSGVAHQPVLRELTQRMRDEYSIHHVTLQMEDETFIDHHCDDCGMASADTSAVAS
jgi:cobalt-zinc-cadmium efflux system protein